MFGKFIFILIILSFGIDNVSSCCSGALLKALNQDAIISSSLSIEEVEKKESVVIHENGEKKLVPFGLVNNEWEILKGLRKEGDCIFHVKTGKDSWDGLYGREAYVLLRGKEIIYAVVTSIS